MCKDVAQIAAGIVLYNPEPTRLMENVQAIYPQVGCVILIDNGSENVIDYEKFFQDYPRIILIKNKKNKGIAAALNQIVIAAAEKKYEWTLLLDQDSVCRRGLIEEYRKYLDYPKAGMFTCEIIDRNLNKSFEVGEKKQEYCIKEVERCITSGSLISNSICREVGYFDEQMFIDYVDYDMCFSLNEYGYKIVKCNFNGLLHELGHTEEKKIFGLRFIVTNHSPIRKYYFSRNIIYCIRKHKKINKIKFMYKNLVRILITLLYEDQKKEKTMAAVKGIIDGFKMPVH